MIDKSIIDEISKNADIVKIISNYFNVTKKGKYFFALCPFHNDTHPSLQIDPERNTFHCWVDGHYGNAFSFVMQYENVGFVEAVKKVADIIGFKNLHLGNQKKILINSKLKSLFDCINDLNLYYEYCLSQNIFLNHDLKKYLDERGITSDIIKKFHLGYSIKNSKLTVDFLRNKGHSIKIIDEIGSISNNNDINCGRLTFPIFNDDNQIVGFSARKIKEDQDDLSPKYINSRDTKIFVKKKLFYNLNNAKKTFRLDQYIYILEGFMDVIALHKIGINSAVAVMGTNLSNDHIKILKKMNVKVCLCFDNDLAGQKATIKAISLLKEANIKTNVVNYLDKDNCDPDEILKNKGPEVLKKNLENLITSFEFEVNFYRNKLKNKDKIINHFMNFFLEKNNSDDFDDYIDNFSKITNIPQLLIKRKIEKKIFEESRTNKTFFKVDEQKNDFLKNIERMVIHYMFYHQEAIEFYIEKNIHFYTKSYNEIADYIVDYYSRNNKLNSLNDLITNIEFAFDNKKISPETKKEFDSLIFHENETNYRGKVFFPQFDQNILLECEKLIKNEKKRIDEEECFNKLLEEKSDEEIADNFDREQKNILK